MPCGLLQVVLQLLAPRRVAKLAQRLGLDLANALAGDPEALAHLLEGSLVAVEEPEAQLEHSPLARGEGVEDVLDLGAQHRQRGGVGGRGRLLVLDEVAEVRVLLLADRGLERHRVLRDLDDLAHLLRGDPHLLGDLLVGGLTSQLLEETARHADQLVDGLDHVHRDPDGASLVGDGAGDGLADPPGRVGAELVASLVLELVHGLHETDVPLLDQVQELEAAVGVLLGDADHEAQVGLDQLGLAALDLLLSLVQQLDALAELLGGNQGLGLDAPDAAPRVLGGLLDLVKNIHGNAGLAADRDEPLPPPAQLEEQGGAFLARHAEPAPAVRELALAGRDLLREIPHPLDQALALDRMEAQAVQLLRDLAAGIVELGLDLFPLRRAQVGLPVPGVKRKQPLGQRLAFAHALQRVPAELLVVLLYAYIDLSFHARRDHFPDRNLVGLDLIDEGEDGLDRHRHPEGHRRDVLLALLDALRDLNLPLAAEQRDAAHLLEVQPDRIVGAG